MLVGLLERVLVLVRLEVPVRLLVWVVVGVRVGVFVGVSVGLRVGVFVGVPVEGPGGSSAELLLGLQVAVLVAVKVAVRVGVDVEVLDAVSVGLGVGLPDAPGNCHTNSSFADEPVNTFCPDGMIRAALMTSVWPVHCSMTSPVLVSHTMTVLSAPLDTAVVPWMSTAHTLAVWTSILTSSVPTEGGGEGCGEGRGGCRKIREVVGMAEGHAGRIVKDARRIALGDELVIRDGLRSLMAKSHILAEADAGKVTSWPAKSDFFFAKSMQWLCSWVLREDPGKIGEGVGRVEEHD